MYKNPDLARSFFNLPSVREFIASLVDRLVEGRSLIVLLPPYLDLKMVKQEISGELYQREFSVQDISLEKESQLSSPLDVLEAVIQPIWPPLIPKTTENFCDLAFLKDGISIWGLENCEAAVCKKWLQFVRLWASISHQRANAGKQITALFLVAYADKILPWLPENDLFLETLWWWKFPSVLEISLLCRLGARSSHSPLDQWREKLIPSIAGGDLLMIDHLWDKVGTSIDELICSIDKFPLRATWMDSDENAWSSYRNENGNNMFQPCGSPPPKRIQSLWARGMVTSTSEYGAEIHSALLARSKRNDKLKHRIWRAQVELLMPIIDSVRLDLCTNLTQRLGSDWPYRWAQPTSNEDLQAVKENPLATQWGYLTWLLKNNYNFRNFREWAPLASTAQELRNKIAHYQVAELKDFEHVLQELGRMAIL